MKTLISILLAIPLLAAEPTLREQLRDALYVEEVTRDPAAAAELYEKILATFDTQRPLAASALFRLAEVRRKQDRKQDAIALYQRLLREFPDAGAEAKLARQNLEALGGKTPSNPLSANDEEAAELRRLKRLAETAPDIIQDPKTLSNAISRGWPQVLNYLLAQEIDLEGSDALPDAATAGRLDLCRILVEHGNMPEQVLAVALSRASRRAIRSERLTVLKYLLDSGVDPNATVETTNGKPSSLLHAAVSHQKLGAVTLLLDYEADIDFAPDTKGLYNEAEPFGTPLHQAIRKDNLKIFNLLIERGAAVDKPAPNCNITPLHLALALNQKNSTNFTKALLEQGADPNRLSSPKRTSLKALDASKPLRIAWLYENSENAAALLAAGAKVEHQDLLGAIERQDSTMLELFLKHTPPFEAKDPADQELLASAMHHSIEITRMLMAHGASPPSDHIDALFPKVKHELRSDFNRNYLLPKLTKQPLIQILLDEVGSQSLQTLADASNSSKPPSIAQALLGNKIRYAVWFEGETVDRWFLWRQNPSSQLHAIDLDLNATDPLPELQWGDVIERRIVKSDQNKGSIFFDESPPRQLHWQLSRQISVPVTVTIGEHSRKIRIRGDRLSYDPTKPEVPNLSAQAIIDLLRPDIAHYPSDEAITATIQREGFHDTTALYRSKVLSRFQFQPGDHLKLGLPTPDPEKADQTRRNTITFRVPGTSFETYVRLSDVLSAAPSLIELIAQRYSAESWGFTRERIGSTAKATPILIGDMLRQRNSYRVSTPCVLPHPDFSNIRILRLATSQPEPFSGDDEPVVIDVNLASAIAACTEATTGAQARAADVILQRGDIVELSLKPLDQPWTGFSPKQALFFKKALGGSIQVTYSQSGEVVQQLLNWEPTRWISSDAGLIPFPPQQGASSTRADMLGLNSGIAGKPKLLLKRDGEHLGDAGFHAFLRDGDRVQYSGDPPEAARSIRKTTPRVRQVRQPRTLRPRRVLPSPSR